MYLYLPTLSFLAESEFVVKAGCKGEERDRSEFGNWHGNGRNDEIFSLASNTVKMKLKTFICRLVNNFYNRRFRTEVCQMKEAITQQCEYLLQEGVVDDQRIEGYFLNLHDQGYSNTYIEAIFTQASVELEHLT